MVIRRKLLAVALVAGPLVAGPLSGTAAAISSTCASGVGTGGVGMFPNQPGSPSQLSIACTLTTAMGGTSNALRLEDSPEAVWHRGAARKTAADGHVTNLSATVTSASGRFVAGDVDRRIAGTGIPTGAFIKAVSSATSIVLNKPATATSLTAVLTVDNSDGRAATGSTTAASNTVTSTTANFHAADVGRSITATSIPHGATITIVTNATSVQVSLPATATATNKVIAIGDRADLTTARQIKDGHTTSASKTVTSASAAFGPTDVGLPVTGTGIPAGDYILSVTNATTVALKTAATATSPATGSVVTIGAPSSSAPQNGEVASQLSSELSLNPAFVDGQPPCSANVVNGSSLSGAWNNPGSFATAGVLGSSTATAINGPVVAQLLYPTSVISFSGYVTIVKAATAGESQPLAHYDVVFPLMLTGTAVCPAPSAVGVAFAFRFNATTPTQGKSGLGSVRELKDFPAGTVIKTASVYTHVLGAVIPFNWSAACTEMYPGTPNFACGTG